jgi:hypothetical protein
MTPRRLAAVVDQCFITRLAASIAKLLLHKGLFFLKPNQLEHHEDPHDSHGSRGCVFWYFWAGTRRNNGTKETNTYRGQQLQALAQLVLKFTFSSFMSISLLLLLLFFGEITTLPTCPGIHRASPQGLSPSLKPPRLGQASPSLPRLAQAFPDPLTFLRPPQAPKACLWPGPGPVSSEAVVLFVFLFIWLLLSDFGEIVALHTHAGFP